MTAPPVVCGTGPGARWRARLLDLVLVVPFLPVVGVVVAVLCVGSMLSLRAWPLFFQERLVEGDRVVRFPKVRTLPASSSQYALKTDPSAPAAHTDRLPWFCRVLRATHLDELPQLFLVLGGTLSLVGPRPKMPHAVEPAPDWYCEMRVTVPQGCTGLWQISADYDKLPHEAPGYDAFYVAHRSVGLDLWVLARTVLNQVGVTAPVTLSSLPARFRDRCDGTCQTVVAGHSALGDGGVGSEQDTPAAA